MFRMCQVDARIDSTKVLHYDEEIEKFYPRVEKEDHYTITDPYNCLTHVTLDEGTGAKMTAEKIMDFLWKVVGVDSTITNTRSKDVLIHHIEVGQEEIVLWDVC